MEASQKPQLRFDEDAQNSPLRGFSDRMVVEGPNISPEGVARLQAMINFVLPRLTRP